MSIVVRDLLKLDIFKKVIELKSDDSGMSTLVNWPYVKQMKEIKPWINGGEIIFVTGNCEDSTENEQLELIKEGGECKVAAFVFLVGDKFIKQISQKVIGFANSIHMPVFTMPYDVKIVDVIKEIANEIVLSGNRERMIINFMTDLLHNNFKSEEHIIKQGYECGINIEQNCMSFCIETNFNYESENYSYIMSYREMMDYVLRRIEQIGVRFGVQAAISFHMERTIGLFAMEDTSCVDDLCKEIDEFLEYYFKYNELTYYIGYGGIHKGLKGCQRSINESKKTVAFAKKSDTAVNSYHYNDLGLLCLLVSSNSRDELMDYCNSVLGALIQSDKNNKTEYIITAKTYLENNNNLVSTANQLFVHRNTLINRINHIEDLIGRSLKDAETKLELLCAFKLLEFLIE